MNSSLFPLPYYAVIFTSLQCDEHDGYAEMAERMETLAASQEGYLGFESARDTLGISISYWSTPESIFNWKKNAEHLLAQQMGKDNWYRYYRVRVCKVEREYTFGDLN